MYSTSSRCRPTIRSESWRTSSRRLTSATSPKIFIGRSTATPRPTLQNGSRPTQRPYRHLRRENLLINTRSKNHEREQPEKDRSEQGPGHGCKRPAGGRRDREASFRGLGGGRRLTPQARAAERPRR